MPVHIVERLQKMNRAERTLWTVLGREPTLEEIAEEANLTVQQVLEVKAAARASSSLDAPVGDAGDAVLGDFVAGDEPAARGDGRARAPQPGAPAPRSCSLPDREREVVDAPLRPRRHGAEDARADRPPTRPHPRARAPDRARLAATPRRPARDASASCSCGSGRVVAGLRPEVQLERGSNGAQLAQGTCLELSYALARDPEHRADLLERLRAAVRRGRTAPSALAAGAGLSRSMAAASSDERKLSDVSDFGRARVLVLDQVAHHALAVADRRVERHVILDELEQLLDLRRRELRLGAISSTVGSRLSFWPSVRRARVTRRT